MTFEQRRHPSLRILKKLDSRQNRVRALQLRKEGTTVTEIAQILDLAPSTISSMVKKALQELPARDVDEWRNLELERLEALHKAVWDAAVKDKDLRAIDRVLRIMERRAKLLGLDPPVKIDMDTKDHGPEIIEISVRDPEAGTISASGESVAE